ncbi:DUF4365 domain-containing protein [Streptomyces sp. NRRL S-1824]|uniref:DUF4365 domain-containing protein n=1 Tax=Streptomyces sp. NRRL S-1824 TaxID=1463889 RepID=UPI00099C2A2D|nr:DUF4365 domain-containing protein [Streptomyces sp. NRRL S-1824]
MALNREVHQGRYGEVFFQAVVTAAGMTAQKLNEDDYMMDFLVGHPGPLGRLKNPMIGVQVKCTRKARVTNSTVSHSMKSKYYNELAKPASEWALPTFLVVVLVPDDADVWMDASDERLALHRAAYWACLHDQPQRRDLKEDSPVTVSVPRANLLSKDALLQMFAVADQLRVHGRGVPVQ